MNLVISFDDTGSMNSCRKQVKSNINLFLNDAFKLYSDLKVGIIIHNDYCDRDTIQHLDLTSDKSKIIEFVNKNTSQGGGDADECYELALNYAHSNFSWSSDEKVFIIIGDCNPHNKGYKYGSTVNNLDWREELNTCVTNGIKVLPIQCLGNRNSNIFYDTLGKLGGFNIKLELSQFAHITQYLTATLYQQAGQLETYENSDPQFKTNFSLKNMFAKLRGEILSSTDLTTTSFDTLSEFQVMPVLTSCRIKDFVEATGATYRKGKGYYQLVNSELIQGNKEVFFVNKSTGEVLRDTIKCRDLMGLPYGVKGKINPRHLSVSREYDIYVQSNSYTRDLDKNTKFMYQLDRV